MNSLKLHLCNKLYSPRKLPLTCHIITISRRIPHWKSTRVIRTRRRGKTRAHFPSRNRLHLRADLLCRGPILDSRINNPERAYIVRATKSSLLIASSSLRLSSDARARTLAYVCLCLCTYRVARDNGTPTYVECIYTRLERERERERERETRAPSMYIHVGEQQLVGKEHGKLRVAVRKFLNLRCWRRDFSVITTDGVLIVKRLVGIFMCFRFVSCTLNEKLFCHWIC